MRHLMLLTLLIFSGLTMHGQSFELLDRQDTYQSGTGQNLSIPLKIKNTSDKAQVYVIHKIQEDAGSARKGYFCFDRNCQDVETEEFSHRLEPGETLENLNFTIETGFLNGIHTVKFEIYPKGFPTLAVDHQVTITVDERPAKTRIYASREITIHDIYPNPVSDQAFMEYNVHSDQVKAKLVIHNILGKLLGDYELPLGETKIRILTEDLPAGVYLYTVYLNNEGVLTRKLIVRK